MYSSFDEQMGFIEQTSIGLGWVQVFKFMSSDTKEKFHPLFPTPHNLYFLYLIILIIYLVYGTGVVSDDFTWMAQLQTRRDFLDLLIPIKAFASVPIQYFSDAILEVA